MYETAKYFGGFCTVSGNVFDGNARFGEMFWVVFARFREMLGLSPASIPEVVPEGRIHA